jgi:hypothetical protein
VRGLSLRRMQLLQMRRQPMRMRYQELKRNEAVHRGRLAFLRRARITSAR